MSLTQLLCAGRSTDSRGWAACSALHCFYIIIIHLLASFRSMPVSSPHPKQPCMLGRGLVLFPDLTQDSRQELLHADLSLECNKDLWLHLPQPCRQSAKEGQQLLHPTLWPKGAKLSLHSMASYCLAGIFPALRVELKCVGYWLVLASQADRQAVAREQAQYGSSHVNLGRWWQQYRVSRAWTELSQSQKQTVTAQAAMALFCSPALTVNKGMMVESCLYIKKRQGHVLLQHGYPHLVLQRSPCRVMVACHVLVAWLFQGKPKVQHDDGGGVVCHHDNQLQQHVGVVWQHGESNMRQHMRHRMTPACSRCVSSKCLSPLCLTHGTRSDNSRSGRTRGQVAGKRGRDKLQEYTGPYGRHCRAARLGDMY